MSSEYTKGKTVVVLDYPFGKPTRIKGEIVGILPGEHYNVLLKVGCNQGNIVKYKYWKLKVIS